MIDVPLYQPVISVVLFKTIGRTTLNGADPVSERFAGTSRKIDLTPYLGDGCVVQTTKHVRQAAGGFNLVFADRAANQGGGLETLYGLIEPMDMIEIRMAHDAPAAGATKVPIIMRGFVSQTSRTQAMGQDGRPQRNVMVSGQDYGKIWQQIQILYTYSYITGQDVLSEFQLFARYGVGYKTTQTGSDFLTEVVQKIINPYLAAFMPSNPPLPASITMAATVAHGTTSLSGSQNAQGSIFQILQEYLDVGAWNELFLEDREDGVYCVYRPNPTRDLDGKLIQSDATEPGTVDLLFADVMSISVARSDANVANYYWVTAPRFDLVSDLQRQLLATTESRDTILANNYVNSQESLYGIRPLQAATQMGGDDVDTATSGQPANLQAQRDSSQLGWVNARRALLVAQNKDNVLFESGTISLRGRPDIKAGMTLRLHSGGLFSSAYIVQVDHQFTPFGSFTTTLQIERGTGFIERIRRGSSQSPYLQEQAPPHV